MTKGGRFHEHLLVVEVLVRCPGEALRGATTQRNHVSLRSHGGNTARMVRTESSLRRFYSTHELVVTPDNLRLRAELLLVILRVVLDRPLLSVHGAEVLVVVRVVMVVEAIHALVRLVHLGLSMRVHVESCLLEDLRDLCRVQVLQLVEIDCLQQLLLLVGQRREVVTSRELLE